MDTLEKENALSSWQIARNIGSCISDASEATRMLHYLTYYGKIVSNPEKGNWKIIRKKNNTDSPSMDFRVKYIQNYIKIIEILTNEPQSIEELANKTSLELNEINQALSYLSLITEKGYVHLQGSGPRQEWILKPWF